LNTSNTFLRCVQQHVFAPEREEEEIRALWNAQREKCNGFVRELPG
jgi:hypothetical protein